MTGRPVRRWLALGTLGTVLVCSACSSGSGVASTSRTAPARTTAPAATSAHVTTSAPSPSSSAPPSAAALAAPCLTEDDRPHVVKLQAAGETLEALTLGSGTVGIVLTHQLGEDLCEWRPYAMALARQGYRVLTFSEGQDRRTGVVEAAAELRREGASRVILVGASIGGTAVLAAAAVITPPVAAVVDLSGPAALYDVDAAKAVPRLTMPVLFCAGSLDEPFVTDTKAMYKAATRSQGRRLLVVQSGSHGVDLVTGTTQKTIEAFLRAHAKG